VTEAVLTPTQASPAAGWTLRDTFWGLVLGLSLGLALDALVLGGFRLHVSDSPTRALIIVTLTVASSAWMIGWAYVFSLRRHHLGLTAWGFVRPRLASLWAVPVAFLAAFLVSVLYGALVHPGPEKAPSWLLHTPAGIVALVVSTCVVAPLAEEAFFRGFALRGLTGTLGWSWAALVSSALFGLVHLDPLRFLPLFAQGLVLCWVCRRGGSVWSSVTVHVLWNLLATIAAIASG